MGAGQVGALGSGAAVRTAVSSRRRVLTACALGGLSFLVYLTNLRPMGAWDSVPARLLPFSILREGNLDLDEFHWLRRLSPKPYFLRRGPTGHWLSGYTVALPVLMAPLSIPVVWWLQRQHIPDDDVRFRLATIVMERANAALLAALSVALVFLATCSIAAVEVAAASALVYALGSSTWTIGSQALWQHGAAELSLAGLSLCLLGADTRRNAIAAGGFAALGVLVRPTMAVFALVALVFVWRERRVRMPAFLSLPLLGMGLLLAYNMRFVGLITGAYQHGHFRVPHFVRLVGLLVSPSRGLLVYTPAAALAVPVMLRREARLPRWLAYLSIGCVAYVVLYSAWPGWWGGYAYGPRFLTDVLPALTLCAAPTVERLWRLRLGRVALLVVVTWGVAVQAIGAYCDDGTWNAQPTSVNSNPWRLWDLDDLQIVRAARAGWHGSDLGPLLWQALTAPQPALLKPLDPSELGGDVVLEDAGPLRGRSRGSAVLHLRVTNRSAVAWPAFSDLGYLQIAFVYRWWLDNLMLKGEGGFVALPRNLGPGASMPVQAQIDTPRRPGSYVLEFDLVQVLNPAEGASGGAVLRVPVQVE